AVAEQCCIVEAPESCGVLHAEDILVLAINTQRLRLAIACRPLFSAFVKKPVVHTAHEVQFRRATEEGPTETADGEDDFFINFLIVPYVDIGLAETQILIA